MEIPNGFQLMLADFVRGLPPTVVDWFLHSKDPRAIENRENVKAAYARRMYRAAKRQEKLFQWMKEESKRIDPKAPVRPLGKVDEDIASDYMGKNGKDCFHDPHFINDCKKTAPELFYPKP